jgi:hypothetical protein
MEMLRVTTAKNAEMTTKEIAKAFEDSLLATKE